jgi:hypothetical protein
VRARSHRLGRSPILQQLHQDPGQFLFGGDADGLARQQVAGNSAEVGVVRTHDDGNAKLCRFQRIVSTGGNQTATDEGHGGQRVDRGQFADRIEEDDFARMEWARRAIPLSEPSCAFDPRGSGVLQQHRHCGKPLWVPGREHHGQTRFRFEQPGPGFEKRGFLTFQRTAGDNQP